MNYLFALLILVSTPIFANTANQLSSMGLVPIPKSSELKAREKFTSGYNQLVANNLKEAAVLFEEGLAIDSGNSLAWIYLGTTRQKANDIRGAENAYLRALGLSHGSPSVRRLATDSLNRLPIAQIAEKPELKSSFTTPNGDEYEGFVKLSTNPTGFARGNLVAHGKGVLIFKNGNRYIGDFVEGKLTGRGEMHWAFGDRYNGDFIGDKRTGRGEYLWKNGNRYVGDIVDSKLQGRGELRWADGSRYIGDFVLDKRQGFGVYIYPNEANRTATKARYSGNWVGGNPNGFGVYEYISRDGTNTSIYQGEFKDGQFHGFGQRDEKNSGGRPKYKTSIGKFEAGNYVGRPAVESGEYAVRDEYEDENRARAARNRSDNEEIYKQARDLFDNYLRLKRR